MRNERSHDNHGLGERIEWILLVVDEREAETALALAQANVDDAFVPQREAVEFERTRTHAQTLRLRVCLTTLLGHETFLPLVGASCFLVVVVVVLEQNVVAAAAAQSWRRFRRRKRFRCSRYAAV